MRVTVEGHNEHAATSQPVTSDPRVNKPSLTSSCNASFLDSPFCSEQELQFSLQLKQEQAPAGTAVQSNLQSHAERCIVYVSRTLFQTAPEALQGISGSRKTAKLSTNLAKGVLPAQDALAGGTLRGASAQSLMAAFCGTLRSYVLRSDQQS